jgi:Uma2 family endonuclease
MGKYILDINDLDMDKTYTYADYILWKFQERVELFKGKIMRMSPAPNVAHQKISANIFNNFYTNFQNKNCDVFYAPFDVALTDKKKSTSNNDISTIVQPDICIICDKQKIADGKKCIGAPELIVEILSPGNSKKEMDFKYDLYQEAGVLEYWLVFPEEKTVQIFILQNDKFIGLKPFTDGQTINSTIFSELQLDIDKIFQ